MIFKESEIEDFELRFSATCKVFCFNTEGSYVSKMYDRANDGRTVTFKGR